MISCLRGAAVAVDEVHVGVWENELHRWNAGLSTLARLASAEARLLTRAVSAQCDALIVGYPGHLDLPA